MNSFCASWRSRHSDFDHPRTFCRETLSQTLPAPTGAGSQDPTPPYTSGELWKSTSRKGETGGLSRNQSVLHPSSGCDIQQETFVSPVSVRGLSQRGVLSADARCFRAGTTQRSRPQNSQERKGLEIGHGSGCGCFRIRSLPASRRGYLILANSASNSARVLA
jgi:hypothetical protein